MYRVMGNIRHKDRNHLELIKQIIWQEIRRKEQRKGVISVRKKMASDERRASARVKFYANLISQTVSRRLCSVTSTGQSEIDK